MLRLLRHGYGTFDRARPIGPAEWPHHDLLFVHSGQVALEFPGLGRSITLSRCEGALIWPRTPFSGRTLSQTAVASIQHFDARGETSAPFDRCVGQKNGFSPQRVAGSPVLNGDVRRALALARRDDPAATRRALLALILAEGGFLETAARPRPSLRIARADLVDWLQANLGQNPGVPRLAQLSGLSTSRFRAVFLAEHGQTAGEFLRAFREAEARRLLAETPLPLKAIAAALGYSDPVAFHRAFKTRAGLTPAKFRREHRVHG